MPSLYSVLVRREGGEYAVLRRVGNKESAEAQVKELREQNIDAKLEKHKPSKK